MRVALALLLLSQFKPSPSPGVGGSVGACTLTATGISCPTGKFDALDAGVANVVSTLQANGAQLEASASGVFVRNDFTVTTGNDAIFSRHARVNGDLKLAGAITDSSTLPTISAGGCTSPSIASNNGTAYFEVTIGTSCTGVSTFTLAMPTVSLGYHCECNNKNSATADIRAQGTTSVVVVTNYGTTVATPADYTAGHVIACACRGG